MYVATDNIGVGPLSLPSGPGPKTFFPCVLHSTEHSRFRPEANDCRHSTQHRRPRRSRQDLHAIARNMHYVAGWPPTPTRPSRMNTDWRVVGFRESLRGAYSPQSSPSAISSYIPRSIDETPRRGKYRATAAPLDRYPTPGTCPLLHWPLRPWRFSINLRTRRSLAVKSGTYVSDSGLTSVTRSVYPVGIDHGSAAGASSSFD